ncbi:MAG: sulfurtransferase TusA family protein [Methylobacterium mesophilicum]|nr:sulfurtransferase TusA family protein [Methylobacterium mesophilicum]
MSETPTLDLRGLRCPLPVLRSRKALDGMRPGEALVILTTDPLAGLDIPAFLAEDGHRLLSMERTERGHRFGVERGEGAQRS